MRPKFPARLWVSMTYEMKKLLFRYAAKEEISVAEVVRNSLMKNNHFQTFVSLERMKDKK